jgi:hypothetical protein|tara:strand:- start:1658 stop:1966 length:309 start_codon:yes stop_codon:yes gene_type:complete
MKLENEIKIVRLVTGEELLCTVTSDPITAKYNLTDVAILIPTEANSLGLAPFMGYSTAYQNEDGMDVKEQSIMFIVDPVDSLRKQYQTMFSKILAPASKIIL